ncbi:hypothetical protein DFA_02014 [Cavenderia fasciculata]|uniref:HAM1-like N-terminal domain-containing protein n=1 Tax=Cavenderia fasciculata TaxID=261658 RepID=F4PYG3_CACFS|nr:uncharacterized protein DFA_02014 [Cavenderia fasciculata]EGG19229.1 hypothetical protein DFA_02014 [Cavenderia fasciculata]|eukprot:XP_004357500.1 hypothetical protein DFA_02014 [Cavenderia fasciculata]
MIIYLMRSKTTKMEGKGRKLGTTDENYVSSGKKTSLKDKVFHHDDASYGSSSKGSRRTSVDYRSDQEKSLHQRAVDDHVYDGDFDEFNRKAKASSSKGKGKDNLRVNDDYASGSRVNESHIKDPRAAKYHDEFGRTQVRGAFDAPILDRAGNPINAATTNVPVIVQMKRHFNSLERLMETRIFRERTDDRTKKIIYDVRNIFADAILITETRGTDKQVMDIAKNLMSFGTDLGNDAELKTMMTDWRQTFVKLATGDQSKGMLSTGGRLFSDLRSSDSIIRLLGEGAKFLHMLVLDSKNPCLAEQREIVFELFFKSFGTLSQSQAWHDLLSGGRSFTQDIGKQAELQSKIAAPKFKAISGNQNLNSLGDNIKIFLQSLIRDKSVADVDKVVMYGQDSMATIRANPQYTQFFNDLQQTSMEIMERPELMDDPATRKVLRDMYARAEVIITETRNTPALQKFASESTLLKDGIMTDELNSRFFQHCKQLYLDLHPVPGRSAIDLKLMGDLKMLFVPFLLEEFRTISIPSQSGVYAPKDVAYRIGNINLSSVELLPENIHFEIAHKANTDPYTLSVHDPDTIVWIEFTAIRARIEQLHWAYEKRSGFPKLRDSGLADVFVDGRGMRVGAEVRLIRSGGQRVTQVLDAYCHIDRIRLNLSRCKHRILYKIIYKLFYKRIKSGIEKAVAEKLAQTIAETDYKMVAKFNNAKQDSARKKALLNQRVAAWKSKSKEKANKKKAGNAGDQFMANLTGKKVNNTYPTVAPALDRDVHPIPNNEILHTTQMAPVTQMATQTTMLEKTIPAQVITTTKVEEKIFMEPDHPNYVGPSSN